MNPTTAMAFNDVLLKYGPMIAIAITFVISLFKPDNTVIPKSVTPKTRAMIAGALGVAFEVITSLDSGGGVVSTNPSVVALLATLAAFGIHGVKGNGADDTTGKGSSVKPPPATGGSAAVAATAIGVLAFCVSVIMGAACLPVAATVATECTMTTAEADYAKGETLAQVVGDCMATCGGDYIAILTQLMSSKNAALAAEAAKIMGDKPNLPSFGAKAGEHAAKVRATRADAGS